MGQTSTHDERSFVDRLQMLPAGLLLTLLGVLVASALSLFITEYSVRSATQYAAQIAQVLQRLDAASDLKALLLDVETSQRGFLLTEDARYLEPYKAAKMNFAGTLDKLRQMTPSRRLRQKIDELGALVDERVGLSSSVVMLVEHGQSAQALALVREGHPSDVMDQFRTELRAFESESNVELAELRNREGRAAFWPRVAVLVSALLVFGLLITVTQLFMRDAMLQSQLARATEQEAQRMQRLVDARTAELSDLSSHLQTASEREKAELARNLHDELGGLLTAARMDLSWLQGATKPLDPEIGQKLQQLSQAFTEAMDVKRRVVESLRPALLDHFGLPAALQNYFEDTCKQAGLNCKTWIPEEIVELPQDLAIALFRVGQESLTNIIRHAKARNVEITLDIVDDVINVVIRDDGAGLNLAGRQFRGSHGINGMRHRIHALGGAFEFASAAGEGTQVRISVPRMRPPPPVPFADSGP